MTTNDFEYIAEEIHLLRSRIPRENFVFLVQTLEQMYQKIYPDIFDQTGFELHCLKE